MMHFFRGTRGSRLLHLAGALTLATACSKIDDAVMPLVQPLSVDLAMDISNALAAPGEQVALVFTPTGLPEMGGFQGYLTYDASKLAYVGQETADGTILMINKNNAASGQLRLAALNPQGLLPHVGTLVFKVLRPGYAQSFRFKVEEAATNGTVRKIDDVSVLSIVRVDRSLSVPSGTHNLTGAEWVKRVEPTATGYHTAFTPGQIVPGLTFGDANLSLGAPAITLSDGVYVINLSVGLNELIVGTDSPARDGVVAGNVFPANNPGLGEPNDALPPGYVSATNPGEITLSDALAIINESVGINQDVVGELIPGRPASPATNRIIVNANITTNTTWTKNNIYELRGGVQVTGGATLTIEAGTLIEGERGTGPGVGGSALFVQRDGMINAIGTPFEPIVFTCVGTPKSKGCWGGITINGNAGLNEGTQTSPVIAGRAATGGCFEKAGEGTSGLYGGCNDADNSGTIRYARIEYAGFRFTTTNELNGVAFQGVGSGTTVDHLQAHAGLDDGFEFFGGTVNAKYLVATANQDDNIDWVEGYRGKLQYIVVQQDSLDGDKGFEGDNTNTQFSVVPRSLPTIWNATIIGKANPSSASGVDPNNNVEGGMHIRRGTRPNIGNILVQNEPWALRIDESETCATDASGGPFQINNSIFSQNATLYSASSTGPCITNFLTTSPSLNNQFPATSPLLAPLNVLTPDWRPAFGLGGGGVNPPSDPFFDQAGGAFIGGVAPANASKSNIPWYAGWTRGWQSATVP